MGSTAACGPPKPFLIYLNDGGLQVHDDAYEQFDEYKKNPVQFEKRFIKEISEALNINESQIKFIGAREG